MDVPWFAQKMTDASPKSHFFTGEYDEANIVLLYRGGPIFSDKPQDTEV